MTRTIQTTYLYRLLPTAQQEALFRQFAGAALRVELGTCP